MLVDPVDPEVRLDDSGGHKDTRTSMFMLVGGAIAPYDKWAWLESEWGPWESQLRAGGSADGLHMKTLFRPEVRLTDDEKLSAVSAMVGLLETSDVRLLVSMENLGFIGATEKEYEEAGETPDLCFANCVRLAAGVTRRHYAKGERAHFMMSQGRKRPTERTYFRVRDDESLHDCVAPSINFGDPKDYGSLQAADLIAHFFFWCLNTAILGYAPPTYGLRDRVYAAITPRMFALERLVEFPAGYAFPMDAETVLRMLGPLPS